VLRAGYSPDDSGYCGVEAFVRQAHIEFISSKTGGIEFVCGMNMLRRTVVME
jgi:plastocyanin domain-containing protein